jgi:hypothetical protein
MCLKLILIQKFAIFYTIVPQKVEFSIKKFKESQMFHKKNLKVLQFICIALLCILAVVYSPAIGALVIGGVINLGILGGFSGKVGPVVGAKWKDVDYMRGYVIPANPNTPGQQTVRARFGNMVAYARAVLTTLIHTYWDPFYSNMSGYNAFISTNYGELTAPGVIDASCIMSKGTLEPIASITSAVIAGTNLTVTFNETISGNGLATDVLKGVVFSINDNTLSFITSTGTRADSPTVFVVPSGTTEDDIFWLFCHRGTGSEFVVSDSKSIAITS